MFRKIVWATDGSEGADRALDQARELASGSGTTLFALHVEPYFVGAVLGSATHSLLHSTSRPVLAVPPTGRG